MTIVTYFNRSSSSLSITCEVCKDGSCSDNYACYEAIIDYVVGPSCTGEYSCYEANIDSVDSSCTEEDSCFRARIGSVDSSCKESVSCSGALFSGVDLINSCNGGGSCVGANDVGAFDELIDCCNDDTQCEDKDGLDIVDAGGPSCVSSTCLLLSNIASPFVK